MAKYVTSEAELTALYGPHDTVVATIKEIDHISEHYRMFIDLSPFVMVATLAPVGLIAHHGEIRPGSCVWWTSIPSCYPIGAAITASILCET